MGGHDGGVALYVDRLIDYTGRVPYRHKVWCHLVADSDELPDDLHGTVGHAAASGTLDAKATVVADGSSCPTGRTTWTARSG